MKFIDGVGNVLEEQSQVAVPLALGKVVVGTVVKTDTGLSGPPHLSVAVMFHLEAHPNGVVPGVLAIPKPSMLEA